MFSLRGLWNLHVWGFVCTPKIQDSWGPQLHIGMRPIPCLYSGRSPKAPPIRRILSRLPSDCILSVLPRGSLLSGVP